MDYTRLGYGQEVWIKSGPDKGRKGSVVSKGFGMVNVKLDAETKSFGADSLTAQNPQTVPLPPNFLPLDYKLGDTVEVQCHGYMRFNGIVGTVDRLPTSTTYQNGGDMRYRIKVTDGKDMNEAGDFLYFEPHNLKEAAPKTKRVEGEEIAHADVQINDVIRVEVSSGERAKGYKQVSSKEGTVAFIRRTSNAPSFMHDSQIYTFKTGADDGSFTLNYAHKDEKITLVKAAPNPFVKIVKDLKPGSVVNLVKSTGEVLTYIKARDWLNQSQWHKVSSMSQVSSCFVTDEDVVAVIDLGAKIVHKVTG